jgi:nucleoside-triphosphatase
MKHAYLLTGKPQSGKTTTIKTLIERIGIEHCGGFYTEEIRVRETRVGFRLVTLDGQTGIFAHVNSKSSFRIGRYGVNLGCLESLGIAAIKKAVETKKLIVIDEIGPMELYSEQFKRTVMDVFISSSLFLATIALKPHPWLDTLKQYEGAMLYTLTSDNQDTIIDTLVRHFAAISRGSKG